MSNRMSIIQGNMFFIEEYQEIMEDINNNKVPKKWSLSKFNNSKYKDIDSWLKRIKYIFGEFNKWISDGFLNVYDLSIFSDEKLFMTLLPIYFQKKLSEKSNRIISSDKIKLNFKLTKYEALEEIGTVDEVVAQIAKETPLVKLVKERVKPKKRISTFNIILLIIIIFITHIYFTFFTIINGVNSFMLFG